MSEPRFENIVRELRGAAPPAPDGLRDRMRALPEPAARHVLRLRPALVAAALVAVAVGIGAAAIGGLTGSPPSGRETTRGASQPFEKGVPMSGSAGSASTRNPGAFSQSGAGRQSLDRTLAPGSRLQQYGVSMRIRVRDLSRATRSAVRTTRKLDGYVANANYSTSGGTGDSLLELRVPIQRVQQAIASFTELGTILSQQIAVADLQAGVDRADKQIAAARKVVKRLEGRTGLTLAERTQLETARGTIARLSRSRASLVRQGTYARVSLTLTTRKAAAKHIAPGRFERFWGDAGDILGKEAIIVLYALVVAGPFALLAALAFFGERARRRRADGRLLEETG